MNMSIIVKPRNLPTKLNVQQMISQQHKLRPRYQDINFICSERTFMFKVS